MTKKLTNKIALITGGGRGIGKEIALALGSEAATVVLTSRTETELKAVAEQIETAGGKAITVVSDMADLGSLKQLTDFISNELGGLDLLVNNAGITCSGAMEETDNVIYQRVMDINARAPYVLCRDLLGLLRKSDAGYIINISSVVGVKGYALQTAYSSSKHALRGMSIALAEELRDTNIRVHVICPGGTATEMVSKVRPDIALDELIDPKEVAELVHYLITHKGNAMVDELHIRRKSSAPWF